MVLEKAVGPEILLWAFWGEIKSATHLTPMCQSPVSCPHFPPHSSPSSARLYLRDSWSPWKALEGHCRRRGRDNSGYCFSLLSASGAGVPLWLGIPEGRTTTAPVSAPEPTSGPHWSKSLCIPPASGPTDASCKR